MLGNKNGFYIVIILIITFIVMLFGVIVYLIIENDYYFLDDSILSRNLTQNKINAENMIIKFYNETNSDGGQDDILACSGGLIFIPEDFGKDQICNGEWINSKDDVFDKSDNDDYKSTFYSGSISGKLDPSSRIYDNDDYARKYQIGIVYPNENKTILYLNDYLMNTINSNKNNIGTNIRTKIPRDVNNLKIELELGNTNGIISINKIDKTIFNTNKDIKIIEEKKGAILNKFGFISQIGSIDPSQMPYIFDIHTYDYAINLKNNSNSDIISYKIKAISNDGNEVYIVGINE